MVVVVCPACGLKYLYHEASHNCKTIREHGMCNTCLGYCPSCLDLGGLESGFERIKGPGESSKQDKR